MAQFYSYYPVELSKGPTKAMLPPLFAGDASANRIGARVTMDGAAAALSGSVSGIIKRSDGTKVTTAGSVSGNLAYITLSSAAYTVPGNIQVLLNITSGSTVTTLLDCSGIVKGVS